MTGSEEASRLPAGRCHAWARLKARFGDAEALVVQRLAGTVFLIRVASAGARLRLAGAVRALDGQLRVRHLCLCLDLGAADRAVARSRPRHRGATLHPGISRAQAVRPAARLHLGQPLARGRHRDRASRALCAGLVRLLQPWLDDYTVIPLYLACIALPAYALANVQDGISRSYDWVGLGIVPTYIVRQLLLTVLMAAAYFAGLPLDAVTAMIARLRLASGCRRSGRLVVLNRRLAQADRAAGRRAYEIRLWLATALPILMAEGFYLMLAHTDVLMLQQFRPPDEVAVYYAAAKTLALVALHPFLDRRHHGAPLQRATCDRRPRRRSRIPAPGDPLDVLAVAARDRAAARDRQAAAVPVRTGIRRRLSPDVHPRDRALGARRDRADGAPAQHAGPAARLCHRLRQRFRRQCRALLRLDPALRRDRRRDRDRRPRCSSRPSRCSSWRGVGSASTSSSGAATQRRGRDRARHDRIALPRRVAAARRARRHRPAMARAGGARDRAERLLRAGLCARGRAGVRTRRRRRPGLVARDAARLLGLFPGAHRAPALRRAAAGAGRLDPSLWRRSARRWSTASRRGRDRAPGSIISRATSALPEAAAAAAICRRRARSRDAFEPRWRGAAARASRFAQPRARAACAGRRTAPTISTRRSGARSARNCAASCAGSANRRGDVGHARAIRPRSSTRSTISSHSRRAAGRAAPAPPRGTIADIRALHGTARSRRSPAKARRASTGCSSTAAPIAAIVLLRSGDTAWGWKIAYDESCRARFARRAAPADVTRRCSTIQRSRAPIPAPPPTTR